jgi:hypothetical protein
MTSLDERIEKKEQELRDIKQQISGHAMMHEKKPGEPVHFSTSQDVLTFGILTDQEKILIMEHDLLLNEKNPTVMKLDRSRVEAEIETVQHKIEETRKLLKS